MTSVEDKKPNWDRKKYIQFAFMDTCNTILYSDNEVAVQKAYNNLFNAYKFAIVRGDAELQLSCLEDVVNKILQQEINKDNSYYHGEQYPAFVKLLAMIAMQNKEKGLWQMRHIIPNYDEMKGYYFPLMDLNRVLLSSIIGELSKDEKNEALKLIFNKYITIFKVQK